MTENVAVILVIFKISKKATSGDLDDLTTDNGIFRTFALPI